MGNRNNAIIAIIVCFVLFFVFAMLFFGGKTKRNKIIKPKDSNENNMIGFSQQSYKKGNNKTSSDSNGKIIKTAPQNIYENEKNLKEIKEHMEIVRRKVNRMKEMKENINEQ